MIRIEIDHCHDNKDDVAEVLHNMASDVADKGLTGTKYHYISNDWKGGPLVLRYDPPDPLLSSPWAEFSIENGIEIFAWLGSERRSLDKLEDIAEKVGKGAEGYSVADENATWTVNGEPTVEGKLLLALDILEKVDRVANALDGSGRKVIVTALRGKHANDFYDEVFDTKRWEALKEKAKKKVMEQIRPSVVPASFNKIDKIVIEE